MMAFTKKKHQARTLRYQYTRICNNSQESNCRTEQTWKSHTTLKWLPFTFHQCQNISVSTIKNTRSTYMSIVAMRGYTSSEYFLFISLFFIPDWISKTTYIPKIGTYESFIDSNSTRTNITTLTSRRPTRVVRPIAIAAATRTRIYGVIPDKSQR